MSEREDEFDDWCRKLMLPEETRREIDLIRSSPPARRVKSGPYNVKAHFNRSNKMPHTIQSESRKVEWPAILLMEEDDDVLEIWDQPPSFVVHYKGNNGRNIGHVYTADFFVLRRESAGWEEWKPEAELIKLAKKNAAKYFKDDNGVWHFPPGERYAQQFGLYFHVCSSAQINWVLFRNYKLLKPYIDALREER